MQLKEWIEIEKHPHKGLMGLEWVVIAYTVFTLLIALFCYTKLEHPEAMIWDRVRMAAITVGLWVVYRLVPCRVTRLLRVAVQLLLLSWWYGDTYNINKLLPNLDHVFASLEQQLFGFQPALVFCERFPQPWVSETLDMAYASYFFLFVSVIFYYFFRRYDEFERCSFVILASFFSFYAIYDLLPVVGPMYYYHAVGVGKIAAGVFPDVGSYFATHTEMMKSPGYTNGLFYQLIADVHNAGEHPTAAFPSSHVGISVIALLLAWHSRSKGLFFTLLPFVVLICFATVYIRAHYAIDVVGGLVAGVLFYLLWSRVAKMEDSSRRG